MNSEEFNKGYVKEMRHICTHGGRSTVTQELRKKKDKTEFEEGKVWANEDIREYEHAIMYKLKKVLFS